MQPSPSPARLYTASRRYTLILRLLTTAPMHSSCTNALKSLGPNKAQQQKAHLHPAEGPIGHSSKRRTCTAPRGSRKPLCGTRIMPPAVVRAQNLQLYEHKNNTSPRAAIITPVATSRGGYSSTSTLLCPSHATSFSS
jgi:hypothetical protein